MDDHVRLGRTGLHVSRLCLRMMTFGLQSDEPTSLAILDMAARVASPFSTLPTCIRLAAPWRALDAPKRSLAAG